MTGIVDAFKYSLLPGSEWLLLLGVTLGVFLLYVRPRAGRRLLVALLAFYWLLSTPLVAGWLERRLMGDYRRLEKPADLQGATAIVVLGAGSLTCRSGDRRLDLLTPESAFSVLEAARLFTLSGGTALVITSGGRPLPDLQLEPESEVMRDALVALGVPAERIVQETGSLNTRDQARILRSTLAAHQVQRFVLVASPIHMWRAVQLFRAQRLDPVAGPAALKSDGTDSWRDRWWPTREALLASRTCAYHYMAIAYAWGRGWMRPAD